MNGFLNFRFFGQQSSRQTASIASLLFGSFILFATLAGCEKDTTTGSQKGGGTPESGTLIPSCGDPLAGNTVLELIRTPDDPTNDRINMMLYHYAQAIRVVAQNPTHLCYMETPMIADIGGIGVSLYSLAQGNSSFAQALNAALRQSMSENNIYPRGVEQGIETSIANSNWDANAFLREKMEYAPYKYDPVVYFIKRPAECAPTTQPVVVIAQDVNDCDDVAGWRASNEVLVSENEANNSSEIIIFVGPGLGVYHSSQFTGGVNQVVLTESGINENVINQTAGQGASDRTNIDIDADLHQIKAGFRYESGKRSEVTGWLLTYTPEALNPHTLRFWEDFDSRKIHKDDINASKVFTDDLNAFPIDMAAFTAGRSIFYGTWEKDWYASGKAIVNTCSSFIDHSVGVKMKFSHEWYFFNCGVASTIFPTTNSTWEVNSAKCRFILKRTN